MSRGAGDLERPREPEVSGGGTGRVWAGRARWGRGAPSEGGCGEGRGRLQALARRLEHPVPEAPCDRDSAEVPGAGKQRAALRPPCVGAGTDSPGRPARPAPPRTPTPPAIFRDPGIWRGREARVALGSWGGRTPRTR
jgi:hypothetical protein